MTVKKMNWFSALFTFAGLLCTFQVVGETAPYPINPEACSRAFFHKDLAWIEKNYGGFPDVKNMGNALRTHQDIDRCANSIRNLGSKPHQFALLERAFSTHPNSDIWGILFFCQKLDAWRDQGDQKNWGEKLKGMREIENWVQEYSVKRYRYYSSWHVSRLRAMRTLGWSADITLAAGIEAVKAFPERRDLVFEATAALSPHSLLSNTLEASWANSLAMAASNAVPSERRHAVFTRTVLATTDWFTDVRRRPIQMQHLSWDKMQLGFEQDWEISADIAFANIYAHLACLQGDGPVLRKVMNRLGERADDNLWRLGSASYIGKTGELQRCKSLFGI